MTGIFNREHEPPEPGDGDVAYDITKAIVGVVVAGSVAPGADLVLTAADLVLRHVFGSPFARRQQEWSDVIAERLRRVESERGVNLEDLRDNPAFIDAAASAYQAFIKTSDEQKRAALRNAVVNCALPSAPPVIEQQLFLTLVDRLTPLHLAVVGLFRDPTNWSGPEGRRLSPYRTYRSPTPRTVLEDAFPQLGGANREMADVIWADLQANGLIRTPGLNNSGEGDTVMKTRVTDLGQRFVRFISDPLI